MLSTSRKEALESLPSQNNIFFKKNWIPAKFHWQEKGYFIKTWFFLISIIVSTSENKSFKIFYCLRELIFFSIIVLMYKITRRIKLLVILYIIKLYAQNNIFIIVFFLLVAIIIEVMRKPIFTEKPHCSY